MNQKNHSKTQPSAKILIVDDEAVIRQVFSDMLKEAGYHIDTAADVETAQSLMDSNKYDVVITDIVMPKLSGIDLLKSQHERSPDIPFVLVTGNPNLDTASEAIRIGAAVDYLIKPVTGPELLWSVRRALEIKRVHDENHRLEAENLRYQNHLEELVKKRSAELAEAYYEVTCSYNFTLDALVAMLDSREKSTGQHSVRVREFALILAYEMSLSELEVEDIARGTLLHDIGKIAIPDSVLLKPGKLTEEEWVIMRTHSQAGYDIISSSKQLEGAAEIVLSHHERFDGKGYPRGLKGNGICLGARIFSIVDSYDAMRSVRVYKEAMSADETVEEIKRCSGTQFDPRIVEVFMKCLPQILQWDTYDQENALLTESK